MNEGLIHVFRQDVMVDQQTLCPLPQPDSDELAHSDDLIVHPIPDLCQVKDPIQ